MSFLYDSLGEKIVDERAKGEQGIGELTLFSIARQRT